MCTVSSGSGNQKQPVAFARSLQLDKIGMVSRTMACVRFVYFIGTGTGLVGINLRLLRMQAMHRKT